MQNVDLKDLPFVALVLHLKARLWTGDRRLTDGLRAKNFPLLIATAELSISESQTYRGRYRNVARPSG